MEKLDKWQMLKLWIGSRHDHLEVQYKQTNFSADAAELGALRGVYQTMGDLEERERRQLATKDPIARAATRAKVR